MTDTLRKVMVMMILVSLMFACAGLIISPFVSKYSIDDPELESYNSLDAMVSQTSEMENNLKGLNNNTSPLDLSTFIIRSAYTTFINGLTSLPIFGGMLVSLSEVIGLPVEIVVSVLSILTLGVIFALGLLFLQVISK